MKTLITVAAAALLVAGSAAAQDKGPSGIFTSEGFGFNEGTGSFAGCQSGGQGRGGDTRCRSGASLSFTTTTSVFGTGEINAGNFAARNKEGTYQRGAFGVWGADNDYLAIGAGGQGTETTSSFVGYQFTGEGDFSSQTTINGSNFVETRSGFWSK